MVEHSSINFIKKVNINRLLNNSKLSYFLILTLALFIGCYHLLNKNLRNSITSFITLPIVLIVCMISILFVGYYNITFGLLMVATLFIILYPLDNIIPDTNQYSIKEGFSNSHKKKEKEKEKFRDKSNERQKTVNSFKNYFRDIFDEAIKEEKEEMEDMISENLNNKLKHERRNNNKSNNRNVNRTKESMTDVIKNNTPNVNNNKRNKRTNNNYQTIRVRKFDPTNDEDTNLLITKEILEDIINRITFEYESVDYLKRYISTRLQEIIRINRLLKLDNNEDD